MLLFRCATSPNSSWFFVAADAHTAFLRRELEAPRAFLALCTHASFGTSIFASEVAYGWAGRRRATQKRGVRQNYPARRGHNKTDLGGRQ